MIGGPKSTAIIPKRGEMSRSIRLPHHSEPVVLSIAFFYLTYSTTFSEKSRPGSFGEAEMSLTVNQGCDNLCLWFNMTESGVTREGIYPPHNISNK
jgi:hypothetical protein